MRPRMIALAMALLLAAGQAAGCAGTDTAGEPASGKPLGANTDIWIAGVAILSVLAAGVVANAEGE